MDDFIAAGVDVIAVSVVEIPQTSTGFDRPRCCRGFLYFTFDSDAPQSNRIAYFGSSERRARQERRVSSMKTAMAPNGGKCIGFVGLPRRCQR